MVDDVVQLVPRAQVRDAHAEERVQLLDDDD